MHKERKNEEKDMIWCVEDDRSIRDIILYTLETCGFEGRGFDDASSFYKALEKEKPDLILLDIMLPGESGSHVLKTLKKNEETASIPVIMTTAKGMETDKIAALDLGADDYLVKPFGMMEMVARIKAVLRRSAKKKPEEDLSFKGIRMDQHAHEVYVDGEKIDLTYKEYELLKLFLSHPGRAYSRDELLLQVWNTDFAGETRTVDVHIRSLRSKLKEYKDSIQTVRGVGYRMEPEK